MLENIFYINLNRRTDRKEMVEKELFKLSPTSKITRIEACERKEGTLGCTLSHIKALTLAMELNLPHICIVEDDIKFTNVELLLTQMEKFKTSCLEWDVLLLCGNVQRPFYQIEDYCLHVTRSLSTAGYIVKQSYYETLLKNFINGFSGLLNGEGYEYKIDVHWQHLQMQDNWFILYPLTVTQYAGYSDVDEKITDWDYALLYL